MEVYPTPNNIESYYDHASATVVTGAVYIDSVCVYVLRVLF
jgi:hypothetical protein